MKRLLFYIRIISFFTYIITVPNKISIGFSNSVLTINDIIINKETPVDNLISILGKPDTEKYISSTQFIRYVDPGPDTLKTKSKIYEFTTKGIIIEYQTEDSRITKNRTYMILTLKFNNRHHENFKGNISIDGVVVDSSFNRNKVKEMFKSWLFVPDSLMCYKSDNENFPFCNYCGIKFNKRKKVIDEIYFNMY
jgi:hypothetical protein